MKTTKNKSNVKEKTIPYYTNHTRHTQGHYIVTTNDPKLKHTLEEMGKGTGPNYSLSRDEMGLIGRLSSE